MKGLAIEATRDMVLHVSRRMIGSRGLLTQADKAIGDGDHGIGMARGFEAVAQKLATPAFAGLKALFDAAGMALLTSAGGAAGAVFGTFFRGGASGLEGLDELDAAALVRFLQEGLRAVQKRGHAQPGDKTMVDALEPATQAAQDSVHLGLEQALEAAARAPRSGMEQTKDMVARVGKAKTLGDRSLGHADPGALSLTLIVEAMAEYVRGQQS